MPSKQNFVQNYLYDSNFLGQTDDQLVAAFKQAYQDIPGVEGITKSDQFLTVLLGAGPEHLIEHLDLIRSESPFSKDPDTAAPCVDNTHIYTGILKLQRESLSKVTDGSITDNDFIKIVNAVTKLTEMNSISKSGGFFDGLYLKRILNAKKFDLFAKLHDESGPFSDITMASGKNIIDSYVDGSIKCHNILMSIAENHVKSGGKIPDQEHLYYFNNINLLIHSAQKSGDKQAILNALEFIGGPLSMKSLGSIRSSINNGVGSLSLIGHISVIKSAKEAGIIVDESHVALLIHRVSEISKQIGSGWAKMISDPISKGISECLVGMDSEKILQGNKSNKLVACLQHFDPNNKWVAHANEKGKRNILMDDLGL